MTRHMPEAVFWCLVIGAPVGLLLAVREWLVARRLRALVGDLDGAARIRDEELDHLVAVRLPALAQAAPAPGLAHRQLTASAFDDSLQAVLNLFEETATTARTRSDESARASLMATMRALQGLANEQQAAISRMQGRYDDAKILQDLLEIDHTNSQFGRRAQVIAVLCGAWPGRQRAASSLDDVVRGARSRIRDYLRVQVQGQADVAVVERCVEPVVLAVAELLDNAARHSPSHTAVQVNLQRMHHGAVVMIDDGGVGMHEEELAHAAEVLSGRRTLDVTRLDDPPQFGFAVIGMLAARYGFRVSVDSQSPYGGVRAVVFVPSALLTTTGEPSTVLPPPAPLPAPAAAPQPAPQQAPQPMSQPAPLPAHRPEAHSTASGLPKRHRRAPSPYPREDRHPGEDTAGGTAPAPPVRPAREAATLMGALQRGTRSGRAAAAQVPPAPVQPTGTANASDPGAAPAPDPLPDPPTSTDPNAGTPPRPATARPILPRRTTRRARRTDEENSPE